MAEYKNGVNFRGNMSVEADDISPEVKTGRVVFVDEDLYESNEEYKAKVDKCVEEGFMRSDEAGSGGSSGGGAEPLIVTHTDDADAGVSRLDITFGELYEAFENGASIYSYHDDGSNKEWREMASIGRSDDDQYGHSGWIQFGDSERYDTEWLSTEEAMLQAYPSMSLN